MLAPDILLGDCVESMRSLPSGFVHTCVTSPPYFGLRDYGHEGQIGLEETPDAYVARLVEVFREVRRVLRDDGTLWLNLGDSYATGTKADRQASTGKLANHRAQDVGRIGTPEGLKTKDLIGIPWRVAFALQADGWYLRSEIIWHKPNPMPESVTDRPTKAHEQIFLLSKSPRYYYDHEAVKEASVEFAKTPDRRRGAPGVRKGVSDPFVQGVTCGGVTPRRNRRSVWTVATRPYKGAHFAVFPPALVEPCILAGAPEWGIVLDPFGGSGTTGMVAHKHNRASILCELNPEYAALIPDRVAGGY